MVVIAQVTILFYGSLCIAFKYCVCFSSMTLRITGAHPLSQTAHISDPHAERDILYGQPRSYYVMNVGQNAPVNSPCFNMLVRAQDKPPVKSPP